jgi:hypothetical protein
MPGPPEKVIFNVVGRTIVVETKEEKTDSGYSTHLRFTFEYDIPRT